MTIKEFIRIFEHNDNAEWQGCNAYQGLQIISKYIDPLHNDLITAASRDEIHSVDIGQLCDAGITEEDVKAIAMLNWMISDGEYLSCFV